MEKLIVLDTNMLLLFVVGVTNKDYISKHKRLQGYDEVDFRTVVGIVNEFSAILFVPHVLSETSSFLGMTAEPIKSRLAGTFKNLIDKIDERAIPSRVGAQRDEYSRSGLTDSVLLEVASSGATLLTTDLHLFEAAKKARMGVINYNQIKGSRFDPRYKIKPGKPR